MIASLSAPRAQARWANEGLPSDPLSVENGAIVAASPRWPLLIDPQLQAARWLRRREPGLRVVQQGTPGYIEAVRREGRKGAAAEGGGARGRRSWRAGL